MCKIVWSWKTTTTEGQTGRGAVWKEGGGQLWREKRKRKQCYWRNPGSYDVSRAMKNVRRFSERKREGGCGGGFEREGANDFLIIRFEKKFLTESNLPPVSKHKQENRDTRHWITAHETTQHTKWHAINETNALKNRTLYFTYLLKECISFLWALNSLFIIKAVLEFNLYAQYL